jgi:pimeloyl-ACP methyl ester carboxylesterase
MNIDVQESGHGFPVVLIHGFPFNSTIWDQFRKNLDGKFRVLTPDLPGLGKSSALPEGFSVADAARALLNKLDELKITDCVVVGHSLGGYVAIEMVAQHKSRFAGLVLFHSTANPDSAEKKENRNKLIEFVERNGPEAFTGKFVATLFSNPDHPGVARAREIALLAQAGAVTGYLAAMRDRPDTGNILLNFQDRVLIISGKNDTAIPPESLKKLTGLSPRIWLELLDGVGHMGMFEAAEKTAEIIDRFVGHVTSRTKK